MGRVKLKLPSGSVIVVKVAERQFNQE